MRNPFHRNGSLWTHAYFEYTCLLEHFRKKTQAKNIEVELQYSSSDNLCEVKKRHG